MKHTDNETTEPVFTDEEEAKYQARHQKELQENIEREHEAIAGDRAYRVAMSACIQSVQNGMDDEEIARFMKRQWDKFSKENPIHGKKNEPKKPAPE